MDALTVDDARREQAQQQLDDLLDSEVAYKFMAGCAQYMSKDGLDELKKAAGNGQRWAFRLLVDAMKVLAKLEMAKAIAAGRKQGPKVKVRTTFAQDGQKT